MIREEAYSYEDPAGILGHVAFSDERRLDIEPDNQYEHRLARQISDFFELNYPINDRESRIIMRALEFGRYQDVIKEPNVEYLYRGFKKRSSWLLTFLNANEGDIDLKSGQMDVVQEYKPSGRMTSSWTSSFSVADEFAGYDKFNLSIIMRASVLDNPKRFVSGPDGLYKLDPNDQLNQHEFESIGFGDINVDRIYWHDYDGMF